MRTYGTDAVVPKYTQKQITAFAKELYKTNLIMWKAIFTAEELVCNRMTDDCHNDEELMIRLAKAYRKINELKGEEDFADMEMNHSYFQEFDIFRSELEKTIEALDSDDKFAL
jgi:hypothetical protein